MGGGTGRICAAGGGKLRAPDVANVVENTARRVVNMSGLDGRAV